MRRFAAILLTPPGRARSVRLALYEVTSDGLQNVWADDRPEGKRVSLPHMIYSKAPNLPVFHFKLTPDGSAGPAGRAGCATQELAQALASRWQEPVAIQLLEGWHAYTFEGKSDA